MATGRGPLLRSLHEMTERIGRAERLSDVYDITVEGVCALLGTTRAAVLTPDAQGLLRFRAWRGLSEGYRAAAEGHDPWSTAEPHPAPIGIVDLAEEPVGGLREGALAAGIRALAFVPLCHRDERIGLLAVYFDAPRALDEEELLAARLVAGQLAFAAVQLDLAEALRRSRDELAVVLDGVADGITAQAPDGTVCFANRAAARSVGVPDAAALHGRTGAAISAGFQVCDEAGAPLPAAEVPSRRVLEGGPECEARLRVRFADGEADRWLQLRSTPVRDEAGRLRLAVSIWRDVTERQQEEVRRAILLEAAEVLGATLDAEAGVVAVVRRLVPRLADMCVLRLVQEEGIAEPLVACHADPTLEPAFRAALAHVVGLPGGSHRSVVARGEPVVFTDVEAAIRALGPDDAALAAHLAVLRPRGSVTVPLTARARVFGTLALVRAEGAGRFTAEDVAFVQDLAHRAALALDSGRLYREAQTTRARLEMSLAASALGTWEFDLATGRVVWSETIAAIHGRRIEDIGGDFQAFLADVHPRDRARVEAHIGDTLRRNVRHEICYRIQRPSGEVRWVEGRGLVHRDPTGAPTGMSGVCMDVTDRKCAELALAAERERLTVTLASIADAVISTGPDGRVDRINEVAETMTGWARAEAIGRPLAEVLPLRDAHGGATPDLVARVHATGAAVALPPDVVLSARGGARFRVEGRAAPERDADGHLLGIVVGLHDVTARRRLEEEVRKASKLESLGVLAGGIAHDFNNILTSVVINLSLADRRLEPDHGARTNVAAATRACERAQDLTKQLLTFARGGEPVKAPTELGPLLHESCAFALQGSRSRAVVTAPPDLWAVDADAAQIGQVVHNLALNAHQAMPEGGLVTVTARNVEVGADAAAPLAPGRYVAVSVSDRGPGIPADILLRVFDPFFTTKPTGSGLGLATSYSILHRHGGHLAAESPAEGGALFTFHLPATEAPVVSAGRLDAPAAARGRGRVLVMDDDEWIRRLSLECLEELGYEAEAAADGQAAIDQWRAAAARGTPFDVVIMDLTVPGGLGGSEALPHLRALHPGVRAIVSSGYSDDPVLARYEEHGFHGKIQKPFRLDDLGRAVAGVLAER